jgi:hypothetical protein
MPRLKTNEPLLGTVGACRYLALHRSTFTSWRRRGVLKPTAVEQGPRGPLFKYSPADLDAFREKIDYDA